MFNKSVAISVLVTILVLASLSGIAIAQAPQLRCSSCTSTKVLELLRRRP
jgi:hypothetical protein